MSKFSPKTIREHVFESLDEMVNDIITEFEDNKKTVLFGIDIIVTSAEIEAMLSKLFETKYFKPVLIDFDKYNYCDEYVIGISCNKEIYVEKSIRDNEYLNVYIDSTQILFVSNNISEEYKKIVKKQSSNTFFYDIKK